ncbi:hypothetical protein TVAG_195610 [Trichomonas vaginalis G3]|uniref:Sialidase domain-containing protein n=1 Tax=Trichomonas vaginalis (strain ATCC PRA-98 / G3) TaxID=412133 RepID=A2G0Y2_TRIV3|nr:sialidase 1 (lysosomal sialidase) family [Trichomonas vaginalis G3]EAX89185.1 hypothetical protein TVAG_195610 [Trichomonas vaginalis G3]KAI5504891.1 sialidase 1 (lysosomal sialidase) family [Trichomonas vaginalis G3]|eukprot:XP_001302115.1 hypothetical protein [Trichomonas vaginalis G3]
MNYFYGKSNILFFSNAASSSGRINMTIRYSLDEGHTFSKGKVVYPKNGGYSSHAITKYFELAMFYEYPDKNGLAVEILRMNWVMDQ